MLNSVHELKLRFKADFQRPLNDQGNILKRHQTI